MSHIVLEGKNEMIRPIMTTNMNIWPIELILNFSEPPVLNLFQQLKFWLLIIWYLMLHVLVSWFQSHTCVFVDGLTTHTDSTTSSLTDSSVTITTSINTLQAGENQVRWRFIHKGFCECVVSRIVVDARRFVIFTKKCLFR